MNPDTASDHLIALLSLTPHPEGGHFKETYRSDHRVTRTDDRVDRSASTAIYYLLRGTERSAWHRIRSDEMWHFYDGGPLRIYVLEPGGKLRVVRLGHPLRHDGAAFQALVPGGLWFAAECEAPDSHSLVGCTVAPGFEFDEFEMADASLLEQAWPEHAALIARLG